MRQNKTVDTPIERGLMAGIQVSRLLLGVFTSLLIIYLTSLIFFLPWGSANLPYPFFSLNDPILALLTTIIGFSIITMPFFLILLTLLANT